MIPWHLRHYCQSQRALEAGVLGCSRPWGSPQRALKPKHDVPRTLYETWHNVSSETNVWIFRNSDRVNLAKIVFHLSLPKVRWSLHPAPLALPCPSASSSWRCGSPIAVPKLWGCSMFSPWFKKSESVVQRKSCDTMKIMKDDITEQQSKLPRELSWAQCGVILWDHSLILCRFKLSQRSTWLNWFILFHFHLMSWVMKCMHP